MLNDSRYHNDETSEFTEVSSETVRKASIYRNDLTYTKTFQQEFDDTYGYIYHRKCYSNYTNIKPVGNLGREDMQASTYAALQHTPTMYMRRSSERKRDRQGKVIADEECCTCRRNKRKKGGGGLEKLSKCLTKTAAETLQMYVLRHNDNPQLQVDVTEVDWEVIVARELLYHRSCYKEQSLSQLDCDEDLSAIIAYIRLNVVE